MDIPSKTILIVDDNEFVRRAIRGVIESLAHAEVCGEAGDGTEAVRQAATLKPDLVVMDLVMPGMNGLEASSSIKKAIPGSCIILFTLYSDKVAEKLAKASGVDCVIAKEQGTAGLIDILRSFIASSS